MLVLSRKCDGSIDIGPDITVTILEIRKKQVKVGIQAPTSTSIRRSELPPKPDNNVSQTSDAIRGPLETKDFEILLVEDDPGHAKLICNALAHCELARPIHVDVAQSGELAMQVLQMDGNVLESASPFDLIMLDLNLPRITGLDLLRRIRTAPDLHLTPVVMFSATDDDAAAANCLVEGANAFVTKSGDPDTFRTSVSRIATFWGSECRIPGPSGGVTV